jgi:hypothetical protein
MTAELLNIQGRDAAISICSPIVGTSKQGFRRPFRKTLSNRIFLDFNVYATRGFSRFAWAVCDAFKEEEAFFLLLDEQEYPYFGFRLSKDWTVEDYQGVLSPENDGIAKPDFFFRTVRFALFGASCRWLFHGDRDFDLICGGFTDKCPESLRKWPPLNDLEAYDPKDIPEFLYGTVGPQQKYQDIARDMLENFELPSKNRWRLG